MLKSQFRFDSDRVNTVSNTELQRKTEEGLLKDMGQALSLSQQLLTMAKNNEWDNFEQLLQNRDQLLNEMATLDAATQDTTTPDLKTIKKPNISDSANTRLAADFEKIRSIQSKLQDIIEKSHASIKLTLTDSQKGNKAIKSYQSNL